MLNGTDLRCSCIFRPASGVVVPARHKYSDCASVGIGFIDRSCSPSSIYAAYNVIRAPKKIMNEPTMGHSSSREFNQFTGQWIDAQLGLRELIESF